MSRAHTQKLSASSGDSTVRIQNWKRSADRQALRMRRMPDPAARAGGSSAAGRTGAAAGSRGLAAGTAPAGASS